MLKRLFNRRTAPPAPTGAPARADRAPTPDLARRRQFLEDHVLIHTHIPKTAGATLAAGLAAIVGGVSTMDLRLKRSIPLDHLSAADLDGLSLVTGHFPYGVHARFPGRQPLYFAAVRDPVERAISNYRFLASHTGHPGHDEAATYDFETWESLDRQRHPNEQARLLMGAGSGRLLDEREAIAHVDRAYFLVIPQPEMTRTIKALRAAFGVAWARVASTNVSVGNEIVPDMPTRQAIGAANATDAALYEHVCETFDDKIKRACDYIGTHCLEKLPDRGR